MSGQYVYIKSEPQLWTVGFYRPDGKWQSESDHESKEQAAERVALLNGAGILQYIERIIERLSLKQQAMKTNAVYDNELIGCITAQKIILTEILLNNPK